jgi:hypothetical protein
MGKRDGEARLTADQFEQADGLHAWRVLAWGAAAWFEAPTHAAGAALVRKIADRAGTERTLPDLDLRSSGLQVRLPISSPGFSEADVAVARAVSAAARELGLTADPSALQTVQLTYDALDQQAVMAFWRDALGYHQLEEDLVDPLRRDPSIWFQDQDRPRPLRNRIHLDIVRPAETIETFKASLGRDPHGPFNLAFADAEGNEADLVPGGTLGDQPETSDWRVLFGAMAFYPTSSPSESADFATAAAELADETGVALMIDLRPEGVTLDSGKDQWEDDGHGAAARFLDLAARVQTAARHQGLVADSDRLRFVQLGIDAVDVAAVRDFWTTVLGYRHDPRSFLTDIYDPRRLNPVIFFQEMDASEADRRKQRNRIHIDVIVPGDQAQARIDAAVAAGGRIVNDADAPQGVTLTDPEGNEVDIAVMLGRE